MLRSRRGISLDADASAACWRSGSLGALVAGGKFALQTAGFAVDHALLPAKSVACLLGRGGGFDTAQATPAHAVAGWKKAHLRFGVMHAAAVAELHFRHGGLLSSTGGSDRSLQHAARPLPHRDSLRLLPRGMHGFWGAFQPTGRAVLSTTRRSTKLEWTPVTPGMRVIRCSSRSW